METNMKTFTYKRGITHAGVFHADDVFSAALLRMMYPAISFERVQKVPADVPEDTIVFDIGFGKYDHHQKDAKVRDNGIKYAAFGLLWQDFGKFFVSEENVSVFDANFVQSIDATDNGGEMNAMYQAVASFNPNWDDNFQDMDDAFYDAVDFAEDILHREILRMKSVDQANDAVRKAYLSSEKLSSDPEDNASPGDIVVLKNYMPWQNVLCPLNTKFVIFPSARGGYSSQAVPYIAGGRDLKVPFPEEWAGAPRETLQAVVPGMTFCHPGRFLISTEDLDSAINACKKALNLFKF